MNARALTLLLGLLWIGATSAAQPPDPSVIEQAVETSSDATIFTSALGALAARGCANCDAQYLSLTNESKFFVGRTPVPFAEFQVLAGNSRVRNMTIYYRAIDNTVTRVVISAD